MIATGTISAILRHKGSEVWSIPPQTKVFDAIVLMSEKNVGALLVMERNQLHGVLSERDYTRKVAIKGKSSKQISVREILPEYCPTASPSHSVEECMRLMTEHRVRHLPILDGNRVVGVVSIGDLVNWIISAQSLAINQLEQYITGQYPSPS